MKKTEVIQIDDVKKVIDFKKVFNSLRKEHPILFSTPMVQAIDAKRKTQTRRTRGLEEINKNPDDWQFEWFDYALKLPFRFTQKSSVTTESLEKRNFHQEAIKCPYGKVGDLLWVRETFTNGYNASLDSNIGKDEKDFVLKYWVFKDGAHLYSNGKYFKGSGIGNVNFPSSTKWKPSIHMPKEAARLWLEIKSISVERLQSISESDAIAEGIYKYENGAYMFYTKKKLRTIRPGIDKATLSFYSLWTSINGDESLKLNPWVWVIEFELLTQKPQ